MRRSLSKTSLLKDLADFVSFKTRRRLLLVLILSSTLGTSYWLMPAMARWWFFVAYLWLIIIGIISHGGFLLGLASSTIVVLLSGRKYKPIPYTTPETDTLAEKMRVLRKAKIYLTENPRIYSAFTNVFASKVYIPMRWVVGRESLSKLEILSVIGHELGHITRAKRLVLELALAITLAYSFAWALYLIAVILLSTSLLQLVFDAGAISMTLFLISFVLWRAEFRSDNESAKAVGPEGLISLFERFAKERDDGSETHPPFWKRIERLKPLLDQHRREESPSYE